VLEPFSFSAILKFALQLKGSEATYRLQHMYTHCNAHSVVIPEILVEQPLAIALHFMQLIPLM